MILELVVIFLPVPLDALLVPSNAVLVLLSAVLVPLSALFVPLSAAHALFRSTQRDLSLIFGVSRRALCAG